MPVARLDKKFAAMRAIGEWVEHQRRQEVIHRPPWGSIGVGGADFDFLLKAVVGESYLRVLRRGGNAREAHAEAVNAGDHCVTIWNKRTHKTRASINGAHELQRWDKEGEVAADWVHRYYLALMTDR